MDTTILQDAINELVLCGGNKAKAAKNLGVPRSTYYGYLDTAEREGIKPTVLAPDAEAKVEEVKIQYEDRLRELSNRLSNIQRDNIDAAAVRKFIFNLKENAGSPPPWLAKAKHTKGDPGVPTLFLSDFHWGEVVDPNQMDNINNFNLDIAHQRLERAIEGAIDLATNHMVNPQYPGLVLACGGDMLSGHIHDEITESNDGTTMTAMFDLFHYMAGAISRLADVFGQVFVVWTYGNHGRNTQRPRHKGAAHTNFDWLLGVMLENHFKAVGDDRVQFNIPVSPDVRFRIYGTNYILTHGDRLGCRGGDGVVGIIGPIVRGIKKVKAQHSALGYDADYVIMGHYHVSLEPPGGVVNGSLKGPDEFSRDMRFEPEVPQQSMWFTHPKHGRTFRTNIFLESKSCDTIQPWVSWEKAHGK